MSERRATGRVLPLIVWALPSHRAGENQQILGLAEALERETDCELRVLKPHWTRLANPLGLARSVSLSGIDDDTRAAFGARSPDLLISAALRNEPVVRWLQAHGRGRTLTVMLGRTWAPATSFDLVVTTPQYRLDASAHVLENPGTLHRITAQRLERAREQFEDRYAHLPRPRVGVLVGGPSGAFDIGARSADAIIARARRMAGNGSLLISTSSRTPVTAVSRLRSAADARTDLFAWQPDVENPFFGILAWADVLMVTGDSIAMLSEAIATGKPVRILDLGGMRDGHPAPLDPSVRGLGHRWLSRYGPRRLGRDLAPAHQRMAQQAGVDWDDAPLPQGQEGAVIEREDHMAETVRMVLEGIESRRRLRAMDDD